MCGLLLYIPYKKFKGLFESRRASDRFVYGISEPANSSTSPPTYTMPSQYITARDDTRIAIDLYLPAGTSNLTSPSTEHAAPVACILTQTRYFRSISLRWPWRLFINKGRPMSFLHTRYYESMLQAGYAVVALDLRGTGASFGTHLHPWHPSERQDSVDVIDWITRQPWSNGRVGLWGMSYEATAAYLTVSKHHPAIRACVPMYMFYDMYNDIASPGGIAQHFFTQKWAELIEFLDRNDFGALPSMNGVGGLFFQGVAPASRDWHDLTSAVADHKPNWKAEINPILDRDTPTSGDVTAGALSLCHVRHAVKTAGVPILFYTGWFDQTVRSSLQGFTLHPERSKVIIGPWNHSGVQFYDPYTQAPQKTQCAHVDRVIAFFRQHLDEVGPPATSANSMEPSLGTVEYFTLGDNKWRMAESWPPPNMSRRSFFLSMRDRKLVDDIDQVQDGAFTWAVNAQRDLGGVSRWQATIEVFNHMHYKGWEAANHVIFTSAPLDDVMTIVGTPVVTLWLASTAPESGDIFVYLTILTSTSEVVYVTEGHLRAAHGQITGDDENLPHYPDENVPRHSFYAKDRRPIDTPTKVTFGLLPIAHQVPRGSCVQVRLSGHDAKHFTEVDPTRSMELTATATRASSLTLPLLDS
ncbi:hypothetical protein, variant 1 [Aphanomyces invadans]|nr:hypothetical protein, variant 1 [Aphanomyces invadans]ETV94357.1 hypothetical protein, variant 1 [Aphanomyces invadans]|eukprot:XP_008877118.1 hypothetical protein, variant 1 [Aphanomyces invadans]